ncbi:MAG: acyl-ACP--UDP-N-acetylglucosamine O-acyltransferase [Pseudomonadota bacterium]
MTNISTDTFVHSTAIIETGAQLGAGVKVGPYAIIGSDVVIGDGTEVQSHVIMKGRVRIGKNNLFSSFASVGSRPQDLKYKGEDTELVIGDNNMFREYCNLSLGTDGGGGVTKIGNDNLFMVNAHVAHDCIVGNNIIAANCVALAGHVVVGDGAVLGGLSAVHQFCRVGKLSMTAGGAMVTQDIVPYGMVHGDRARINGLNVVGLRRLGIRNSDLQDIKAMYHLVFDSNLTLDDALARIQKDVLDSEFRKVWLDFLKDGERGLCR